MIMLNNPPQDALKTASEKAIQKTAEATGDLLGNKTAKMITKVLRISPQNRNGYKCNRKY